MSNENFCILPWINLSTDVNGSLRPCCKFAQPDIHNEFQMPNMKDGNINDLWNHAGFVKLRTAFLNNQRPKECESCWNEEKSGNSSFRKNFVPDKKIDVSQFHKFNPIVENSPISIDLKLNNVCNLKCRICGPQASSTFAKEFEEIHKIHLSESKYWIENKIIDTTNEDKFKLWLKNIQHIEMTGGEPFVSPENIKILNLCVELDVAKNISISINTNCTQYNQKFIEILKKFKKVDLLLSIDDIEERFEYLRFPASWNVVQQNMINFLNVSKHNKNINIGISCTVSVFNVFYLNEFNSWFSKFSNDVFLFFNILHYSPQYSIKNLPITAKRIIESKLTDSKFLNVLNFMNIESEDNHMYETFIRDVKRLDNSRNQSFGIIFKEWAETLEGI